MAILQIVYSVSSIWIVIFFYRFAGPQSRYTDYSYQDFQIIVKMIKNPSKDQPQPTPAALARQEAAARAVMEYCLNRSECRRVQLLQYFGEKFDKKGCYPLCDNCAHESPLVSQDVTTEAHGAIELVKYLQIRKEKVTSTQCRAILRGSKNIDVLNKQHDKLPMHAKAQSMPPELLEQMIQRLLYLDVLMEVSVENKSGYHNMYLEV